MTSMMTRKHLPGVDFGLSRDEVRFVRLVALLFADVAQRERNNAIGIVRPGVRFGLLKHGVQHQGRVWIGHSPEC